MIKSDYKKIGDGIKKVFAETLEIDPEVALDIDSYDIVKYCEVHQRLYKIELKDRKEKSDDLKIKKKKNEIILGFVKGKEGDKEFIRMIFAINDENKKLKSSQKLMQLLSIVEKTVVYIDEITSCNVNGRPGLDMIKYLEEGTFRWI